MFISDHFLILFISQFLIWIPEESPISLCKMLGPGDEVQRLEDAMQVKLK